MSTQTAFLFVGGLDRYQPGINADLLLTLHEGARPAWTAKSMIPELYETQELPGGPLVAESDDSPHLVTDAIFRFCPEISTNAAALLKLRDRLMAAAPHKLRKDHWDLPALGEHDEIARRVLQEARDLIESGTLHAKLVLVTLTGGLEEALTMNLARLNAKHEICRSAGVFERGATAVRRIHTAA
ncbi:MAG: hypothetical protein P9L99_07145 [Candidatus Lernaella stagnicola]|nr:hypothetical protein [Candidatus Lernaella stagnicola]